MIHRSLVYDLYKCAESRIRTCLLRVHYDNLLKQIGFTDQRRYLGSNVSICQRTPRLSARTLRPFLPGSRSRLISIKRPGSRPVTSSSIKKQDSRLRQSCHPFISFNNSEISNQHSFELEFLTGSLYFRIACRLIAGIHTSAPAVITVDVRRYCICYHENHPFQIQFHSIYSRLDGKNPFLRKKMQIQFKDLLISLYQRGFLGLR